LSVDEAAAEVGRLVVNLAGIPSPTISVREIEGKRMTVSVSGLVSHPGTYFLSAGLTLSELLSEAAPVAGSDGHRVAISGVFGAPFTTDPTSPISPLRVGDRVEVLLAAPRAEVFVIGGVTAPGAIGFEEGMTVSQAVSRVGGVSAEGRAGSWRIAHAGKSFETLPDGPNSTGVHLLAGDTVEVPITVPTGALSVIGAVSQPARIDFRRGIRLSELLKAVGGLRTDADRMGITIRSFDGAILIPKSADPVLKPGDWIVVPTRP
jgi:protein involved in polysaccharide export with SLBB domain